MNSDQKPNFEGWAILELMGHRRLGGYIRQEEIAGAAFLRIDVPSVCGAESDNHCPVCGDCKCPAPEISRDHPDCPLHSASSKHGQPLATQFYSAAAIYCVTPTTEEMARAVAARNKPAPVQRWELPALDFRPDEDDRDPEPEPEDF